LPTTFIGLVIFVVLLAPGLVHLLISERGPFPGREVSPLRETANIALSSILFDLLAVGVFGLVRIAAPDRTPDVGRLVREGAPYMRANYLSLAWWFTGFLILACVLALVWAAILNSTDRLRWFQSRWPARVLFPTVGVQFMSAWWKLLMEKEPDYERRVTCRLEDGSSIEGWLMSLNPDVEEKPDRDITLSAPLVFRDVKGELREESYGAVAISGRRIIELYVDYRKR
jgi:hypothetical protein